MVLVQKDKYRVRTLATALQFNGENNGVCTPKMQYFFFAIFTPEK